MHPQLQRQIRRYLTQVEVLPAEFLAAVDAAYASADADRMLIERSLELMSQELSERNEDLRKQLAERQRAEGQLENLLLLLGTILESTADGILTLDKDAKIVRFNQRFAQMWNMTDEEMSFWNHQQLLGRMLVQLREPVDFMSTLEFLCQHPEAEHYDLLEFNDGRVIERYSLPQVLAVENVGRVISFRDVTARHCAEERLKREQEEQRILIKKLEEAHHQLLQSEKMASIGQLAAGVAHEINNPIGYVAANLGSLGNYVERLLDVMAAYEASKPLLAHDAAAWARIQASEQQADLDYLKQDVIALLAESQEGIARVKKIVQDLKDFSRIDTNDAWTWADLHKGIDSTLNIVNNELKYKAEVVKQYGALPEIECLMSQLNQVFLNLLVNAGHAIEGHGTVTIRSGVEGSMVWVEIEDTGKGIAPEHMNRIFDPFFTTKPIGTGTGLGLSLSYGIVEKHHGRIEVQSELGVGTRFRVWLPVRHESVDAQVRVA